MFREEEVALELENQIIQFEAYFGVTPSHLDSHHYVNSIPPVMRAFQDTCISRGIPMWRPERRGCETSIIPLDVPLCDHLVWLREAVEPKEIVAHLANIKNGWTELATHLRFRRESGATPALTFLSGKKFKDILRAHSIEMTSYDELRLVKQKA